MPEESSEFMSPDETQVRKESFSEFRALSEVGPKIELTSEQIALERKLYKQYSTAIPDEFREIGMTRAQSQYEKGWKKALIEDRLDEFIQETVDPDSKNPHANIYISHANEETAESFSKGEKRIRSNVDPEVTDKIEQDLSTFKKVVEQSDLPDIFKREYLGSADRSVRKIDLYKSVGTAEFTRLRAEIGEWADRSVDKEKSIKQNTILLPYEDVARDLLQVSSSLELPELDMEEVLSDPKYRIELSKEEREYIGLKEDMTGVKKLTSEGSKKILEVLLQRVGLIQSNEDDWVIEYTKGSVLSASGKMRKIKLPLTREFTPSEIIYNVRHDAIAHGLRGGNGAKQQISMAQEGMRAYDATEEGVAVITEIGLGQPFGHPRQKVFAARYLAASMMVKVKEDGGEMVPQYSVDEIYDELVSLGVSETDAANTLWRNNRGTSLRHEVTSIPVTVNGKTKQIPIAECFPKDMIYFEGMMDVFNWMKQTLPFYEGLNKGIIEGATSMEDLMPLIGIALTDESDRPKTIREMHDSHAEFSKMGQDAIFDLIHYLTSAGKMPLDHMVNPESEWNPYITRDPATVTNIKKMFEPRTEGPLFEKEKST